MVQHWISVCSLLKEEIVAFFGPQRRVSTMLMSAIANTSAIPHFATRWDMKERELEDMTVNVHPDHVSTARALTDLVRYLNWTSFAVIYDDAESWWFLHQSHSQVNTLSVLQVLYAPATWWLGWMNWNLFCTNSTKATCWPLWRMSKPAESRFSFWTALAWKLSNSFNWRDLWIWSISITTTYSPLGCVSRTAWRICTVRHIVFGSTCTAVARSFIRSLLVAMISQISTEIALYVTVNLLAIDGAGSMSNVLGTTSPSSNFEQPQIYWETEVRI